VTREPRAGRLVRLALLAALAPAAGARAAAQTPAAPLPADTGVRADTAPGDTALGDTARPADAFCWRGRPLPHCASFVLFEIGAHARVADTRQTQRYPDGSTQEVRAFGRHQFSWQLGAMRNVDARTALGGTLHVGGDGYGAVVGALARGRRWTSPRTSLDLDVGPVLMQVPLATSAREYRVGGMTQARVNLADLIAVSGRVAVVPNGTRRPRAGALLGAQLGSGAALGGTVVTAILAALAIAAIANMGG
jgi:hypothetical protein